MKKHILLFAIAASALQSITAQEAPARYILLEDFIQESASKCDVYFTLEDGWTSNHSVFLLDERVARPSVPGDISSVMFALTNSLTNVTVLRDATNKRIYHIIDRRLLGLSDYAVSRELPSIKFRGDGESFINHIKQTVTNISNQEGIPIGRGYGSDNSVTEITIDAVDISVRGALSNGINQRGYSNGLTNGVNENGYNRLMWTATTALAIHETEVHFFGPLVDPEDHKDAKPEVKPEIESQK